MTMNKTEHGSQKQILGLLEEAVQLAETLAAPPADRVLARRVGEELIPALYEASTYVEVGYVASPEVRLNISRASIVASDLTDADPGFGPLHSRLRILQEEASLAARYAQS